MSDKVMIAVEQPLSNIDKDAYLVLRDHSIYDHVAFQSEEMAAELFPGNAGLGEQEEDGEERGRVNGVEWDREKEEQRVFLTPFIQGRVLCWRW